MSILKMAKKSKIIVTVVGSKLIIYLLLETQCIVFCCPFKHQNVLTIHNSSHNNWLTFEYSSLNFSIMPKLC